MNQDTIHPGDDALTIGVKIHRQLEAQIKTGARVLVLSVNSPGGPVSGMPSSIDGIPLRGSQYFIEYTAFDTRTSNGIYEVVSTGDGSGVRTTAIELSASALHELRRSGNRLSKRNLKQAKRAVNRKVRALTRG